MLKSFAAALVAVFLVCGCVTVGPSVSTPPSTGASAAPSLGVSTPAPSIAAPTPTLAPIPTPTVGATPIATASPTLAPSLPSSIGPSASPTAQASAEPGTRDLLFNDDMTDSSSGWQELNENFATITYDSGVLAFRYNQNQSWAYTIRHLDSPETTLLPAANFAPQSDGIFGLLCGDSASGKLYGAVADTSGGVIFLETDNGAVTVLERHDKLGLDVTIGATNPMAVECHADGNGGLSMIAGLSHTGPVAAFRMDTGAPASFDVVGMYGEALSDNYTLTVNLAAAFGVGGADGTMSDGAQTLLAHIPTAMQTGCYESPQFSDAAVYIISCVPQTTGTGAEIERYEQFADGDSMNLAYQDVVDTFGVESAGPCDNGPSESDWQVNEQTGGRVQCAPQAVGIRFDWTDDLTSILASLMDFDGSYPDTYAQWQNAGPISPQG